MSQITEFRSPFLKGTQNLSGSFVPAFPLDRPVQRICRPVAGAFMSPSALCASMGSAFVMTCYHSSCINDRRGGIILFSFNVQHSRSFGFYNPFFKPFLFVLPRPLRHAFKLALRVRLYRMGMGLRKIMSSNLVLPISGNSTRGVFRCGCSGILLFVFSS